MVVSVWDSVGSYPETHELLLVCCFRLFLHVFFGSNSNTTVTSVPQQSAVKQSSREQLLQVKHCSARQAMSPDAGDEGRSNARLVWNSGGRPANLGEGDQIKPVTSPPSHFTKCCRELRSLLHTAEARFYSKTSPVINSSKKTIVTMAIWSFTTNPKTFPDFIHSQQRSWTNSWKRTRKCVWANIGDQDRNSPNVLSLC